MTHRESVFSRMILRSRFDATTALREEHNDFRSAKFGHRSPAGKYADVRTAHFICPKSE
jgi:hypothetical protein